VPIVVDALVNQTTQRQMHLSKQIVRDELVVPDDDLQFCVGIGDIARTITANGT
jgi:hypothetical protein